MHDDRTIEGLAAGLRRLLPRWDLPGGTALALLSVSENATFRADAPGRATLVFRVHRAGYHSLDEIASEQAWIGALRASEVVRTPAVVPTVDGAVIASFDFGGAARHVAAFAFAEGREPRPGDDLVPGFEALGAVSARLHGHARRWQRPPGFVRKRWAYDAVAGENAHWGKWRAALGLTAAGEAVLERAAGALRARLAEWGIGADRFGLIHADLRLANLLFGEVGLTVIDFDDCGFGWYLFDFAAAVSFIEDDPGLPDLAAAWVAGYRSVAPLSADEEAMLPVFVMLRRLQLTAWIASHAETQTARDLGPDYTLGTVVLADRFLTG